MKLNKDRKAKCFQLFFYFVLEISASDLSGYKCLGHYLSREHHNCSIAGTCNCYNDSPLPIEWYRQIQAVGFIR